MGREKTEVNCKKRNLSGVKLEQLGAKLSIEFPGSLSKERNMMGIYSWHLAEGNVDKYTCCPGSDF